MLVCSNCKDQISSQQGENNRSFPSRTVAGGLIGTLVGVVTGTVLVIPLALVAGGMADSLGQRCEMCDAEIADDDEGYSLMEERGDEAIGKTYRPVSTEDTMRKEAPSQLGSRPAQSNPQPTQSVQRRNSSDPLDLPEELDSHRDQPQFVFDEIEGKFVQQPSESLLFDDHDCDLDLLDGSVDNLSMEFEMSCSSDCIDDIGADPLDLLSDPGDDAFFDVDPFGPADEPSDGGLQP